MLIRAGVSRGSVLIEQTGDGAGCLGVMLEVRLAEPGSSTVRRKHTGSAWTSRTLLTMLKQGELGGELGVN